MNRDELLRLLLDLTTRGVISAEQAREIVERFEVGDISPIDLPLPPAQALLFEGVDDALIFAAILAMLNRTSVPESRLIERERSRLRQSLRTEFDRQLERMGTNVTDGGLTVLRWHEQMKEEITSYTAQQYAAGVGRPVATNAPLGPTITEQYAYLYRFAGQVAVLALLGVAMSSGAVASRSKLYGNSGWGMHWRGNEEGFGERSGYVVDYISVDEPSTCRPCLDAQNNGPYLIDRDSPYPGSVCLGGSRCRCQTRIRYDMPAWRRLTQTGRARRQLRGSPQRQLTSS